MGGNKGRTLGHANAARRPWNKGKDLPAETVTPAEAHRLLRVIRGGPTGVRNRACVTLLYRGGLRVGEACQLDVADFDPDTGVVKIRRGKATKRVRRGGKKRHVARQVALDPEASALVAAWVTQRRTLIGATGPLLCTLAGRPLWTSYVRGLIGRLAAQAGIPHRVHPHALRHTFASELARERLPMNAIQAALGHASLATTSTYLAHVAPHELLDLLRARPWTPPGEA